MRRMLFIYNPHAGKGHVKHHLVEFQNTFARAGWLIIAHPTLGPGDAAAAAAELGNQVDRVVCCGGDGTLHEVITGLMSLEQRPQVGYIPAGTTNDFSRNLRLPRGILARAETAAAGCPRPVDVGRFNERYFIYVAAFGAFTDVSYDTPQTFKSLFGHLAYVLEGAARLPSLQSYHLSVTWDGGREEGDFIYGMVSNTISVGGFQSADRNVSLDDGLFEAVLIRFPQNPAQLQSILAYLMQGGKGDADGMVIQLRTAALRVTADAPLPWTLDGEYGGDPTDAHIQVARQAVSIVYGK